MTFASTSFIFAFLPIVLFAYYGIPIRLRNIFLLISAIIFYTLAEPNYVLILILTTVLNYISGIIIEKACISDVRHKIVFLIIPIILNLTILIFFKNILFTLFNIDQTPITPVPPLVITTSKILIPIGISYYILQVISYLIDIYENRAEAETNFIDFALYLTMFPKIIAGPITKYQDMKKTLKSRVVYLDNIYIGIQYFIFGLFKKVLLSNNISFLWESVYSLNFENIPVATAWLGAIAFSFTLYFDMSGYSDMAIGIGKMIGFNLPNNFDYPYMSTSITQFFKRFHITLIYWFNYYIFKPISNNRCLSKYNRLNFSISTLITWILIGIWHGVTAGTVSDHLGIKFSANFIIFGIYFGLILCAEMFFKDKIKFKIHVIIKHMYTLIVVTFGFIWLDPSNIIKLDELVKTMLFLNNPQLFNSQTIHLFFENIVILILCIFFCTNLMEKLSEKFANRYPKIFPILKYIITFAAFFISSCYLI